MLTVDRVLPIALGDNWIYALPAANPAGGLLLIDAGPDYEGAWEALAAQLDAAGYAPADVRAVLITHAHIDHCGLAARWQAAGVPVLGHADEAPRFALGDRVSLFQAPRVFAFLASVGVPAERLENLRIRRERRQLDARRERNRRGERWPGDLRGTPFHVDRALHDGESVRVGDRSVICRAAPGHTPGNAVYFEAGSRALFSGDQLLPHITPNPGIHFAIDSEAGGEAGDAGDGATTSDGRLRSLPAYSRALERIAALGAVRLYPGHGEHTTPVPDAVARTQRHHTNRQARILRFLREGPLTPYDVMEKFFPHLPDARLWQAMAEIVGHLDALVEAGRVRETPAASGLTLRLA